MTAVIKSALSEALALQGMGISVIPIKPRAKEPSVKWKERQQTAYSGEELKEIYGPNPELGVGVVTGKVSGIFVVDIDSGTGGLHALADLELEHGALPETARAKTAGGGYHYYFRYVPGITNSVSSIGGGIDVRGDGGFVVAPPSRHPDPCKHKNCDPKQHYDWDIPITDNGIVDAPKWLIDLVLEASKTPENTNNTQLVNPGDLVIEGKRRTTLLTQGGKLIKSGWPSDLIGDALRAYNERYCAPPLPADELQAMVTDITTRYESHIAPTLYNPVAVSDWFDVEESADEWLIEGLIPRGGFITLAAPAKAGKSSFARDMSVSVVTGRKFLGRAVTQGKVLYLALEERPKAVRQSFRKLGVSPQSNLITHHGRITPEDIPTILEDCRNRDIDLLIVDTIGKVRDKTFDVSDYGSVGNWLDPLMYAAHEQNIAIVALHHTTKGQKDKTGYEGLSAMLGSMNVAATVDQHIGITRNNEGVRVFYTVGRFDDIADSVLKMDPITERLSNAGNKGDVQLRSCMAEIVELYGDHSWFTQKDIKDSEAISIKDDTMVKALKQLSDEGSLLRHGEGRKGSPYSYQVPESSRK